MQTARRLLDRTRRLIPNRDPILDRLLEYGTFDSNGDTDTPNLFEEFAMGHLSAMANWLLMRIESLEAEVCVPFLYMIPSTDGTYASQLSCTKAGFGELYRDSKRHAEQDEQAAQLLDRAMDQIESLECFAHGRAHWIDDLHGQMSELCGEPVPSSVLLSPSLGSEEEVADDEVEVEEEAEVRTLVEAPAF
jgi:hypothetical protein